ncbi:MAG: HPF/RaiA family ribosome-associated protein [Saprospiraceae bacterium]|nr:HPF/RaiA family ribosome-associated protein [Saprospiraceae bacterium]
MNINIQSTNFNASERLQDYVHGKVRKLFGPKSQIVRADVRLYEDGTGTHANQFCEIYLSISGDKISAKKGAATYEQAVIDVVEMLAKTIKRMRI